MRNAKSEFLYDVSVIIPTYNRGKLLSYTLDSLVNQDVNVSKFEVIIGDDGSTDNTREIVDKYKLLLNLKYVFQEDKGYRPASMRNKAIILSEGRICLFIDSSVILAPDCIAKHISFHFVNPAPKVAIGYVYGFDHDEASEEHLKQLIIPDDPVASIEKLKQHKSFLDIREDHYLKYNNDIEALQAPWFYFWTCHLSVPTQEVAAVGMFDEKFDGRWGGEDSDLGIRLHQNGVRICLLRSALSIHYPHGKDKKEKRIEGYQSCLYLHNKHNTLETKIFLENYYVEHLIDINEISNEKKTKLVNG